MPRPMLDRASKRGLDLHQINAVPSPPSNAGADLLHGPDPSIHMLGLPKSYPHLGRWLVLAIFVGAIAAFLLVTLTGR
jgi:hypothetical protein